MLDNIFLFCMSKVVGRGGTVSRRVEWLSCRDIFRIGRDGEGAREKCDSVNRVKGQ